MAALANQTFWVLEVTVLACTSSIRLEGRVFRALKALVWASLTDLAICTTVCTGISLNILVTCTLKTNSIREFVFFWASQAFVKTRASGTSLTTLLACVLVHE